MAFGKEFTDTMLNSKCSILNALFLMFGTATAAPRQILLEVLLAVVIHDLLPGLYDSGRPDEHAFVFEYRLGIGYTATVEVAGGVGPGTAVYSHRIAHLEQVQVAAFVGLLLADTLAPVLDDRRPLGYALYGKYPEARTRSAHTDLPRALLHSAPGRHVSALYRLALCFGHTVFVR